jgi:hypothetical protein
MAGNLIQVGSDGKVRVKSNGIVVAGAGDPCCCSPCIQTCGGSALKAPSAFVVTISGWSNACCTPFGIRYIKTSTSLNGTYDVNEVFTLGSGNHYRNGSFIPVHLIVYSDAGCTTLWDELDTQLDFAIYAGGPSRTTFQVSAAFGEAFVLLFATEAIVNPCCPGTKTLANLLACDPSFTTSDGDGVAVGTGGTAVLTPL